MEEIKAATFSLTYQISIVLNVLTETLVYDKYVNLRNDFNAQIAGLEKLANENRARLKLKFQNEVLANLKETYGWHAKLMERICSLAISKQTHTKKRTAKLPVLKLATFEGDFSKWNNFWTSFSTNVDNNE